MNNEPLPAVPVPHLYLDTNIFGGALEGHRASIHLLELAKDKKWRCSTSVFGAMELSEIRQDNKFIYNQLGLGIHVKKAIRSLDQKDLSLQDLGGIQETIDTIFRESYPFVQFLGLETVGWDRALELKATTNISAPDCLHIATAVEAGCDVFVTLDTFLRKEADRFLKACMPEQIGKTLRGLGFSI